ncbi:TetR/AcrR family transcriptional regulator [Paludisphaera borealis]|uniref:Putative HTH-type transcriptional regulator YxaF n=1 Tax=Paludisphaera borealis TaxID=1387353 RepID=A0A1U7CP30_9BACT|nr:TetR/AcrR family transcriptional regulator [Paludisphaera borealis]APW60668.1 putative HTH-type transcriptional regulator YxaF [Paludisphaera borealis]
MRYGAGRKEETRARILKAAGRVFRRHGYHASGVDKVMEEAGLTAGGFYAHFASKEALFAAMLAPTAADPPAARQPDRSDATDREWVEAFLESYLSASHRDKPEDGCPLPALVSEIARAGGPVKASFQEIVRGLAARIERSAGGSEDRALAIVALCVGGLGVARSVQDEALGERILSACRDLAERSLADTDDPPQPANRRKTKDVF